MKSSIELIADERERQRTVEGWTPDHDDNHDLGEMVDASLSYIRAAINVGHPAMQKPPQEWPWDTAWWKPSGDVTRNLVKAGALIAAEIDRLQRAEVRAQMLKKLPVAPATPPKPSPVV